MCKRSCDVQEMRPTRSAKLIWRSFLRRSLLGVGSHFRGVANAIAARSSWSANGASSRILTSVAAAISGMWMVFGTKPARLVSSWRCQVGIYDSASDNDGKLGGILPAYQGLSAGAQASGPMSSSKWETRRIEPGIEKYVCGPVYRADRKCIQTAELNFYSRGRRSMGDRSAKVWRMGISFSADLLGS